MVDMIHDEYDGGFNICSDIATAPNGIHMLSDNCLVIFW